MKKTLGILAFLACSLAGFSQQDYQFNQFFFDKVSVNPGATGMKDICVGLFFREQWAGFSGNPTTMLLNAHAPVKLLKGGIGITAYNDVIGNQVLGVAGLSSTEVDGHAITTNAFRLHYAYHLKNVGPGTLGLGLSLGFQGAKLGSNWYSVDPVILDNAIPNVEDSKGAADFNFGAYYQTNKFWAGLSSTHLSAQDLQSNNFDFSVARHYYFMTGYETQLASTAWQLKPALMVKSDAVSTSIDVNVRGEWNNFIWGGLSLRTGIDAISPMVGINWEAVNQSTGVGTLQFGYSYDVTLSDINSYSSGSHEVFLGFCYKPIQLLIRKAHSNPRFL